MWCQPHPIFRPNRGCGLTLRSAMQNHSFIAQFPTGYYILTISIILILLTFNHIILVFYYIHHSYVSRYCSTNFPLIKLYLKEYFWSYFITNFDPAIPCTFHIICPCTTCSNIPPGKVFIWHLKPLTHLLSLPECQHSTSTSSSYYIYLSVFNCLYCKILLNTTLNVFEGHTVMIDTSDMTTSRTESV